MSTFLIDKITDKEQAQRIAELWEKVKPYAIGKLAEDMYTNNGNINDYENTKNVYDVEKKGEER